MEEKPNVAGLFYFEIFSAGIRKVSFRFGLGIRIMLNFCFIFFGMLEKLLWR